jgi:hypothetical protein
MSAGADKSEDPVDEGFREKQLARTLLDLVHNDFTGSQIVERFHLD